MVVHSFQIMGRTAPTRRRILFQRGKKHGTRLRIAGRGTEHGTWGARGARNSHAAHAPRRVDAAQALFERAYAAKKVKGTVRICW